MESELRTRPLGDRSIRCQAEGERSWELPRAARAARAGSETVWGADDIRGQDGVDAVGKPFNLSCIVSLACVRRATSVVGGRKGRAGEIEQAGGGFRHPQKFLRDGLLQFLC